MLLGQEQITDAPNKEFIIGFASNIKLKIGDRFIKEEAIVYVETTVINDTIALSNINGVHHPDIYTVLRNTFRKMNEQKVPAQAFKFVFHVEGPPQGNKRRLYNRDDYISAFKTKHGLDPNTEAITVGFGRTIQCGSALK